MKKRLTAAVSELKQAHKYGYIVVNDSVEEASKRIISIIEAEKLRAFRNADLINAVIEEGG
jgi:guanylate kinase